jgi:riboflavin kinase/FMN adenylyltransferase
MKVIRSMTALRRVRRPICLAAGFFDGLHKGHQEVLRRTMAEARLLQGEAWAMTFHTHPLKVLRPEAAPLLLTSTPHKVELMGRMGLDGCLLIPFTRQLAALEPEDFLARLEGAAPTLRHILVGEDWRFGRLGRGDTAMLAAWAARRGIRLTQVPPVRYAGTAISSTRVRKAIAEGRLPLAQRLLDRPFSILGTVVRGQRIGRQLGYPTANLNPHNEVRPPEGIYAVQALIQGGAYEGIVNFGVHPTVAPVAVPLLELHVLDARLRLYGRHIEVFFIRCLRPERRFLTLEGLVRQIRRDVAAARRALHTPAAQKIWNKALQTWYPDTKLRHKKK